MTPTAPGVLLLRAPGNSDPQACKQFELLINSAIATGPRLVVVDLSKANSVSTVMLGLFLKLRRELSAVDGEVRLAGVQPLVRRVLDICRLDKLFAVFSSPDEAMDAGNAAAAM